MKIMRVGDLSVTPSGQTIVAGTNPDLDSMSAEQIKKVVGDSVLIAIRGNKARTTVAVKDVSCTNSIVGKKNIFILLDSVSRLDVELGSEILVVPGSKGPGTA